MTATNRSPRPKGRGGSSRQPTRRSSGSSTTRKAPASRTRTTTKGRTTATSGRRRPPTPPTDTTLVKVARATSRATEGHRADLAGLVLILLAVLSGLGVYGGDTGGPVGRGADRLVGLLVGGARVLVPVALLVAGVLLIRGRTAPPPVPDPDTGEIPAAAHGPARRALGGVLLGVASLGLLHLAQGAPAIDGPGDDLVDAAGIVGALIGEPLQALVATSGALAVLVLLLVAGVVLVLDLTLRTAAQRAVAGVRPAASGGVRAFGSLFHLNREKGDVIPPVDDTGITAPQVSVPGDVVDLTEAGAADPDDPAIYDFEAEAGGGPAPRRRRKTKLPEPVEDPEQLAIDLGPGAEPSAWKLPPAKLLTRAGAQAVDRKAVEEVGHHLERALAEHGVETRLVGMTVGPTVTRYELELGPGVKVARVTSLHRDIAYAMATPDVRILAPIPGKQAIGIEIPNVKKQLVTVGDILASPEARAATHPLDVAVGRDIDGKAVMAGLAGMPHVLIAGATGAGKSSCINSLLTSILMRATPDQVRMILVDPKQVEMGQYNRLPHLLTEVVTDPKKAANALAWAVREMERRYDLLATVGFRDITGYNAAFDRGELQPETDLDPTYPRLPFILVVVDELADLMMVAARDVEESITRIAQKARAVGIHLVIATQRPSVNVITGLIKANVPSRWAFAVSSSTDSRVILDQQGAERLLGKGDMLLLGPSSSVPHRVQGSWVTEEEVRAVAGHWKRQSPEIVYDDSVLGTDSSTGSSGGGGSSSGGTDGDDDDLLAQATELVVRSQLGSTSMLQRKLKVGFARAGRIMDLLEERGVVGPSVGSKAREVLMTVEELDGGSGGDDDAPGSGPGPGPSAGPEGAPAEPPSA
ncbi:DNA translocase FtsK [Iamia sp. SCSIO 61187]|uniref:DNA translocase FtsK n=1 Tax=Iamia sp. SCSIO 61187 TaxID=2722752 RepID=UPI001C636D85|nr:DNA translocase FtsK [Iamia sp. SCSIO 61187]QYG93274.1 DNA translocase FtsK [Iamia sp. SCSIO 61187]